ncbi:MAG: hypothetical protein ABIV51_07555, partial [Saprospiraceae bacterium]
MNYFSKIPAIIGFKTKMNIQTMLKLSSAKLVYFGLFLICFLSSGTAVSQEINATITVVSPRTQTVDKKVFKSMEAT